MGELVPKIARTLITGALGSIAIALDISQVNALALVQEDLFFGRNLAGDAQVSEEQFQAFVDNVVTPRFPTGLTILDASKQFENSTNGSRQEPLKVITLFVEDTPNSQVAIDEIVTAYRQQFKQESVLQVFNQDALKVGFGEGENLIDNDSIPEFIEADLFFGRNLPGGGQVSEEEFQSFVNSIISPRFPAELTIFDAKGQFEDSTGTLIEESTKVVKLLIKDTRENEIALDEIIKAYKEKFRQESVLLAVNEEIAVGFDVGKNLINNDLIPELIEADLFFGRNLPGGKLISEEQFQTFVDRVIKPRFPAGLTILDGNSQFENSTGNIIQEPSKVVRLLLKDTVENELALDEIIKAYKEQFERESVLLVVDEDVKVAFNSQLSTTVPEPASILGLFVLSALRFFPAKKSN